MYLCMCAFICTIKCAYWSVHVSMSVYVPMYIGMCDICVGLGYICASLGTYVQVCDPGYYGHADRDAHV